MLSKYTITSTNKKVQVNVIKDEDGDHIFYHGRVGVENDRVPLNKKEADELKRIILDKYGPVSSRQIMVYFHF